ncbi:hypothetical protein EJC49_15240 [Aquibium carbonis]|jgi:hypothetical protein|uniref:Uncharacterized protein n=1 Tax=Aquibium carbonis TaxID=2495581 RepID=A0A429YVF2_9HYPH|nr:hypothetical protein [Aquibium carbonis]RST85445.1 hypothetical protein EJC49_15240 [Aquibium carbonis]
MLLELTDHDAASMARGGLTDVSLEVMRAFSEMRNIDGLKKALHTHRDQIGSESRPEIIAEIRVFRQFVMEGEAIEADAGTGYLLDLEHPLIAQWTKGGYFMSEKRVAAARRRIAETNVTGS